MIPSTRKIAAGIVVGFLALSGGIALWIHSAADRKFERMERDVKALLDETRKRDSSRPARPGAPLPGNAWEDYDKALAAVTADRPGLEAVMLFLHRDPKADAEKAKERVAAHAATLDLLKSGVRREKSDPALQWELGNDMKTTALLSCAELGALVAARARLLAEDGKHREAAELLLDGCQFARDLGSNSILINEMIAVAIYSNQFEGLRDLLVSGSLSKKDLHEIEAALLVADQVFPKHGQTMLNESLFMGYTLLRSSGSSDFQTLIGNANPALGFWRYGFSARLTFASAYDYFESLSKRAARCDDLSWPESRKLLTELEQEAKSSHNLIVRMALPGILRTELQLRERKAQLRLLRATALWRATGTCPEIDDPLGTKLLHDEKNDLLRVWSVGSDGTDHGGFGTWKPVAGKDILLEWKR